MSSIKSSRGVCGDRQGAAGAGRFPASASGGPALVVVNCETMAPGLAESELFGHYNEPFTDAMTGKIARFELAQGGRSSWIRFPGRKS